MDPPSSHRGFPKLLSPSASSNTQHSSSQTFSPSHSGQSLESPTTSNTTTGPNTGGAVAGGVPPAKGNKKLPHNVDICITCVTDKPPQLPLREELPSLGIEVVYNAQGIGAKASQHEAKKLIEKFRHDEQYKDLKKRRLFAPSSSHVEQKIKDRKRQEDALEIPRGISYEKYEKILSSSNDAGSVGEQDSTSLSGSVSTRGESITSGEKRKHNQGPSGHKKKRMFEDQSPRNSAAATPSPKSGGFFQTGLPMKFSFHSHKSQNSNDDSDSQHHHASNPFGGPTSPALVVSGTRAPSTSESSNPAPSPRYRGPSKATETMFQSVMRAFSDEPEEERRKPYPHHGPPSVSESHSGGTSSSSPYHSGSRSRSEEEEADLQARYNMNMIKLNDNGGSTSILPQHRRQEGPPTNPASLQPPSDHPVHDIRKTPTPEDTSKERSKSSHDVSRDPSSISTNFTKQDPNQPNPVEVLASNDPNVKKYLPGLQTVPSASSSASSSTSRRQVSDDSGLEDHHHQGRSHHPKRNKHLTVAGKSRDAMDQPLNEAFAAFTLNPKLNDDVYDKLGPAITQAAQQSSKHHQQLQQQVPKRQRKDPPASPTPQVYGSASGSHPVNQNIYHTNSNQQTHASYTNNRSNNTNSKSANWMNTAKLAFENVAAEVYKQATGSANNSPNASGGSGNIFQFGVDTTQKPHVASGKQQQPLSPTSTLSSNTANLQQQHQIQIHGHQTFLFPTSSNNATNNQREKENNIFQMVPPPQTHNPFPHHPHVEVHVRPDGTQVIVSSSIGSKSVTAFYEALQQPKTPVDSIQRMLRVCPGLVKVRLQQSISQKGRLGLHTACARGFPHHRNTLIAQSNSSTNLALQLVEDIQQLKKLISVLVEANRGACTVLDDNGDLPAHLLARTLMEWEAQWYEKVYEKVQTDQDSDGRNAAAITKLYQSMSQCIEIVLHPVAAFCNANNNSGIGSAATTLCRAPGSVGLLLPLHIASIFTASVPTLRQLLEQDPVAATVPCNLGHLRTFIPDHSLPLELHDKLSTDFPKWEIGAEARKSKTIQIAGGANMMMEDYMRRSDLLFAFHPTVPRFRMETTRIERLEAKVISEANKMEKHLLDKGEHGHLSVAVKRIWIWMCTFQDINDHFQATYYPSVKRIVDSVPSSTIPYLANVKTTQGKGLSQVAAPECQALLRTRLEQYESTQASRLEQMVAKAVASASNKSTKSSLASFEDTTITSNASAFLSLKGKGYVGVLCRTLFHVHEDSMPTSFILLPYKLTKNEQGKLGIDKNSSATTAVKFAECLLKLTDPKTILYFLEQKSIQLHHQRISEDSDDGRSATVKEKYKEVEEQLLALYEPGKAYLYLIDELIGLPIVPTSGTSLYPIELTQPGNIVQKLLPLMLTGMILMRGEKALSVLVNVLLDKTVTHVSPNWVDAAREIIAYLYSQQDSRSDNSLPGLDALIDELRAFVSNNSSVKSTTSAHTDNAEWAVELSILRMVINMNDNRKSFAGLKAKRDEPGTVLWTKHRIDEELPSENSSLLSSDKKKPDPSLQLSHEDPPGALNGAASVTSSAASTKKSGNHGGSGSLKSGPGSVPPSNTPLSPVDSASLTARQHASPDSNRDIEKLRMKTTHSYNDNGSSPWLEPDGGKIMEDMSIGEADSGMDGEELAGVRILLEAEEGPSLLDQESTTEEEGSEAGRKKPNRGHVSDDSSSASASVTSNTEKNRDAKYRSRDDNKSGSDSFKRQPATSVKQRSSDASDSMDEKEMYHDATESSQSGSEQMMILPARSNEGRRTGNTKGAKESRNTGKSRAGGRQDKEQDIQKLSKRQSDRRSEKQTENEFYLGDSSQSGELGLATSKSQGNEGYLDTTMSNSSESGDEMLLPSTRSRETPRTKVTQQISQDDESASGTPSSSENTHQQLSQSHRSHQHARSKSLAKFDSAGTDEDDDTDESVLKFDFVDSTNNEVRSQASKAVTISGRSADRLYDESRVEVIEHSDGNNSEFSAGKLFEQETMRLQDYAANHMHRSSSPPPSILPPPTSSPSPSSPPSPPPPGLPSPPPPPPAQTTSKITSTLSVSLPVLQSSSSSANSPPGQSSSSPSHSLPTSRERPSPSSSSPPVSLPSSDRPTRTQTPSSHVTDSTPETSSTLQKIITATSFGDIEPGVPITPGSSNRSPSLSANKATLSSRSNTTGSSSLLGRKLLPAKNLMDSRDNDDSMLLSSTSPSPHSSPSSNLKYGNENISKKDLTFLEMREHVTDQALKIDCLETTLESIKIREDKLLSRGEMLQDFLCDLVDQSENLKLESESKAKKVERRLGDLEERLLCTEINSQHLSFRVFAIEEEVESIAEDEYKKEMHDIYDTQRKQQKRYEGLDEMLGRAAKLEIIRAERRSIEDSDVSTAIGYDESILALDGYNSSPDTEMTSERAMGGSYISRRSKKTHEYHRYQYYRQRDRQGVRSFESTTSSRSLSQPTGRSQSQPRSYRHNDGKYHLSPISGRHRGGDRHARHAIENDRSSKLKSQQQRRSPPSPRRDYDMSQLLRNASLDERSIEYEMGLAMFGTLDHSSDNTSVGGRSYPSPLRSGSVDAYERMRSDYNYLGVSAFDDNSVGMMSEAGYSSPGGEYPDMSSLEGDGLDWVKMSSRQSFELPERRFELPRRNLAYRQ